MFIILTQTYVLVGWIILTDERINMDQVCGNHKIPSVFCVVQLFKTINHVNAPWKALSSTFAGCLGDDIWVWLKIRGPEIHWLPTHIIKEQPSLGIFSMDSQNQMYNRWICLMTSWDPMGPSFEICADVHRPIRACSHGKLAPVSAKTQTERSQWCSVIIRLSLCELPEHGML